MKLDTQMLRILSGLEIDGSNVRITESLDRKLYTRINEVLETLGGKWTRKAKAHVFASLADIEIQEKLDEVINFGEVVTAKEKRSRDGFFETPPELAKELVDMAKIAPGMTVLEPSAGKGALINALLAADAYVTAGERDKERRAYLTTAFSCPQVYLWTHNDFLDASPDGEAFDRVVMNPPFLRVGRGDHLDHVMHAFKFLAPAGILVSVLPISIVFRQDTRHKEFRHWMHNSTAGSEVVELPPDAFKPSGTMVRTCVVRLQKAA